MSAMDVKPGPSGPRKRSRASRLAAGPTDAPRRLLPLGGTPPVRQARPSLTRGLPTGAYRCAKLGIAGTVLHRFLGTGGHQVSENATHLLSYCHPCKVGPQSIRGAWLLGSGGAAPGIHIRVVQPLRPLSGNSTQLPP